MLLVRQFGFATLPSLKPHVRDFHGHDYQDVCRSLGDVHDRKASAFPGDVPLAGLDGNPGSTCLTKFQGM